MREITMNSEEAIERVLSVLRQRMQEALKEQRSIHLHAKAGMKSFSEEDGGFAFTLLIDKRGTPAAPAQPPAPPSVQRVITGEPMLCTKCQRVFFVGTVCPWCGEPAPKKEKQS
jgi:hypothetical protein